MNQEEKTRMTREKIMSAAMREFASNGYAGASINTICQSGGISKGNLYHQFSSKEELYIACVRETFRSLTDFLKTNLPDQETDLPDQETNLPDKETNLPDKAITPELYFQVRSDYFRDHPLEGGVFCSAVLFPPLDLKTNIEKCRTDFDELNRSILKQILAHRKIRNDLTEDQILTALRYFQDALNACFRNLMPADDTSPSYADAVAAHEKACRTALSIFLYGIFT